jgi:hypothetical protein
MYRLVLLLGLIVLQPTSLTWGSSYLLHLENGNELRTSYYWEEGNEIKFFIYGGVVGIQKGFIAKVTFSDWHSKRGQSNKENSQESQTSSNTSSPTLKGMPQDHTMKKEIASESDSEKGRLIDFEYYRQRKASLKEKLEDALQRNREATAKKDKQAKDLTRKEYLEFSRQIIDLGDELKRKNKGLLPEWWEE